MNLFKDLIWRCISIMISLLENIEKLHTTELGLKRIKRNLSLEVDDIVKWCKNKILEADASIIKQGKNWYVKVEDYEITVNATSYTIITANKIKEKEEKKDEQLLF